MIQNNSLHLSKGHLKILRTSDLNVLIYHQFIFGYAPLFYYGSISIKKYNLMKLLAQLTFSSVN